MAYLNYRLNLHFVVNNFSLTRERKKRTLVLFCQPQYKRGHAEGFGEGSFISNLVIERQAVCLFANIIFLHETVKREHSF